MCECVCMCVCVCVSLCLYICISRVSMHNNKSNCTRIFVNAPLSNDYDKFNWILYSKHTHTCVHTGTLRQKHAHTCTHTQRIILLKATSRANGISIYILCMHISAWTNGWTDSETDGQAEGLGDCKLLPRPHGAATRHLWTTTTTKCQTISSRFRCRLSCSKMRSRVCGVARLTRSLRTATRW